jgi:probable HAF family extracellular repeat protein
VIGNLRTLCAGLVVTLAASGPIASAATYTVTDLGTLGGTRSYAAGINARGDIVGWSTLAGDSAVHAFLYQSRHGRMIDLDPRVPAAPVVPGPSTIAGASRATSPLGRDLM